jgi:hypothetical protein
MVLVDEVTVGGWGRADDQNTSAVGLAGLSWGYAALLGHFKALRDARLPSEAIASLEVHNTERDNAGIWSRVATVELVRQQVPYTFPYNDPTGPLHPFGLSK